MLEQVFVKLVEGTALFAFESISRWLADLLFWTTTTGVRGMLGTSTDINGRYCEHYTKECAILQQSMGCDCRFTECTLLCKDNQLWFSCTTMKNCSDDSWNTSGHCFDSTVQEGTTKILQGCYNSAKINRDMEDALKIDAQGIAGVCLSQDDYIEMMIVDQNEYSLALSVSDCTFNQSGKLVRMTVSFDEFDSGASCSSSGNEGYSDDESYEFDCEEDFIIFDSDSDGCNITGDGKGRSPSFGSCCSANSANAFDEFCWEGKADFEENLAVFVKGINQCHPFYYHKQSELKLQRNEAPKGLKISNNNIPVICSSANEHCTGKAKELPKSSHVNCGAQDVILDHCNIKPETKNKTAKCVQFKQGPELVTKHSIVAWDFAYRQARIGPWERAAVDRLRFQKRIQELEEVLAPVLLGQKLKSEQKIC